MGPMETGDHLRHEQPLVVQVEQHSAMGLEWRALDMTSFDTAVFAQWRPTVIQAVGQPGLVLDILCVVRKVLRCAMNTPTKVRESLRHTTSKPAIQEELRLLG